MKYVQRLEQLLKDTCDTDTFIRNEFKKIYSSEIVDGDSYSVPGIQDLVVRAVEEIKMLRLTSGKTKQHCVVKTENKHMEAWIRRELARKCLEYNRIVRLKPNNIKDELQRIKQGN